MNQRKKFTEDEYIAGLRVADQVSMSRLYKMHYPMIEHFIINNKGSDAEAKDVFQEAFIVLYENLQKPDFELTCQIKTYLYSVSRRLWLKKLNYKSKFYGGDIADFEDYVRLDEQAHTEEIELKNVQMAQMEQALQKLGEPCRTILEDYYINELSMQQICTKMGYTNTDNAKTQKYKCLNRLKKILYDKP